MRSSLKLKIILLITFILAVVRYPSFAEAQSDSQTDEDVKTANVSLYVLFPDGGRDFAVIYLNGNWSASNYVPAKRGKNEGQVCDGAIVPNAFSEFELAADVYQTCATDQLGADMAKELSFDGRELASKFNGKVFVFINPINGEARFFERPYNGRFKNAKTRKLNDILISQINACKK